MAQYGLDIEGSSCFDMRTLQNLQRIIQTRNDELKSIKAELTKSLNKQQEMNQELGFIKTMVMIVGVFVAICMAIVMYLYLSHNTIIEKPHSHTINYDEVLKQLTKLDEKYENIPVAIAELKTLLGNSTLVNVVPCDCDNNSDVQKTQKRAREPTNENRLDIKLSHKKIQGIPKHNLNVILTHIADEIVEDILTGVQSQNIKFTRGESEKMAIHQNIYKSIDSWISNKGHQFNAARKLSLALSEIDINIAMEIKMSDKGNDVDLTANVIIESVSFY